MNLIVKRASDCHFKKRYCVGDDVSIKEIMDTLKLEGWTGRFIVHPYHYYDGEIQVVIYDDYIE